MSVSASRLAGVVLAFMTSAGFADDLVLDEVIVIAKKREQSLQHVPAAVSVLQGPEIENAGILDVFDVARQIPSFDVFQNAGPINTSFRIRRIGNEANIPNFESAVGLFVDGAFRTRPSVGVGDLFDIDRIELLRGPQTTLYGKNTTAGLIGIYTRKPTDVFELFGEITAGSIDGADSAGLTRLEAVVSGPLTENMRGRVSGAFFDHEHTMVNLFSGDHGQDMSRYGLRAQLLTAPVPGLEARLILSRFEIDATRTGDPEIDEGISIANINAAFSVPCPRNDVNDRAICNNRAGLVDLTAEDVTLTLEYSTGVHTFTSISAYESYETSRDLDADQLNVDLVDVLDVQDSRSFSQELRLASRGSNSVDWLAGAFYYRNDFRRGDPFVPTAVLGPAAPLIDLMPGLPFGQPGDSGFLDSRTDSRHFSLFGNALWRAGDNFDITVGGRWQTEDKASSINNSADHTTPTLITLGLFPVSANATLSRDTDAFTWEISGQYRWTEDVMAYLSVSKGFKSGGFNAGFGNTPVSSREFDDEEVISFELGVKTQLWENRMRLNAAIFHAEYDDFQSAGWVSLRFLVNNAERVDVSGFEFDLQALLHERLTAAVAVSFADAEYEEYNGGSCHFGRLPDNADGSACVMTGDTLPLAPKWKTSTSLIYQQDTSFGEFYTRADWSWIDEYHTNATLDPRHVQESYSLINLRAGIHIRRFEIVGWIHNLGDETYTMQDGPTNLFGGDPGFGRFLGAPRSFGLTVRLRM